MLNSLKTVEIYEKIERYGISAVTTEELYLILLDISLTSNSDWIDSFDLSELSYSNFESLKKNTKLKEKWIIKLLAAIDFSNRVYNSCQLRFGQLISSQIAGEIALSFFQNKYQEHLVGFFLDVNKKLIKSEIIFKGTLDASIACPRDVLAEALKYHAHSFILAHNHPSGECIFSKEDLKFTKKMKQAAKIMGIGFTDHIIIGSTRYLSMREEGLLN